MGTIFCSFQHQKMNSFNNNNSNASTALIRFMELLISLTDLLRDLVGDSFRHFITLLLLFTLPSLDNFAHLFKDLSAGLRWNLGAMSSALDHSVFSDLCADLAGWSALLALDHGTLWASNITAGRNLLASLHFDVNAHGPGCGGGSHRVTLAITVGPAVVAAWVADACAAVVAGGLVVPASVAAVSPLSPGQ